QPRLLAQDGEFGMGNGMDGHAGKDLLVKVPCGTMVWQLESPEPEVEDAGDETETAATTFKVSASQRGRFRTTTGGRGLEVDLSAEADKPRTDGAKPKGELVADFISIGQRFV